jgi:hypothetical protein
MARAVLPRRFPIKYQRDVEARCHLHRKSFLTQDKRLKRMKEIQETVSRQKPMNLAVGSEEIIIQTADVHPILKVSPTDISVEVGRPCDGKRVHSILVFQDMRSVHTVFTSAAGHEAVVGTVFTAISRKKLNQFPFPLLPVDHIVPLGFVESARVTNTFIVELQILVAESGPVLILVAGRWTGIGYDALLTKPYGLRKTVV